MKYNKTFKTNYFFMVILNIKKLNLLIKILLMIFKTVYHKGKKVN